MNKIVALIAALVLVVAGVFVVVSATSADAKPKVKVGVCHRTASETNPYVYIEVPEDEANGHITGTSNQHNNSVTWPTAGTWNGEAHAAGDLRLDYYATVADSTSNCAERTVEPPFDACPNIPGDQPEGTNCDSEPPVDVCPDIPGDQPEGTDCTTPEPPVDVCPDVPGDQPEGTNCDSTPPTEPPVVEPPVVEPPVTNPPKDSDEPKVDKPDAHKVTSAQKSHKATVSVPTEIDSGL